MDTGKNRASRPGHLEMLALCQGIPKTHRRNHRTWKTSSMVYHSERKQSTICEEKRHLGKNMEGARYKRSESTPRRVTQDELNSGSKSFNDTCEVLSAKFF